MKVMRFSQVSLLVGLALGVAVLWTGAAPVATGADSLIGGWYPSTDCPRCTGTDASSSESNCPSGYTYPGYPPEGEYLGCSGGDLTICLVGGTGSKCCGPDLSGGPICNDNNGQGSQICNTIHDATCLTSNCDGW